MQKYHPNLGKLSEGAKIGTISNQFLEVQDHSLFQSSCRYIQQSSHPWKKASAQRNNQSVTISKLQRCKAPAFNFRCSCDSRDIKKV